MRNTTLQRWMMPAALNLVATAVVLVAGSRPAFASTPAQSVAPPTVGDILIAPLSSTSVMVDAALDPNGLDTTYVVNFGTTAAYGLTTSPQNAGSGTAMLGVAVRLSGLLPETTYHVDLLATNAAGTSSSGDRTFVTHALATPTVSTVPSPGSLPPVGRPTNSPSGKVVRVLVMNPAKSFDGLSGVSCASTTFCLAAGFQGRPGGLVRPLVERWTGQSFATFPSPTSPGASLYAISCPSSAECLAVGRDGHSTYSARWTGHSWLVEPTPSPVTANGDILRSVSCVSAVDCWAAGYTDGATTNMAILLEHWNGHSWSIVGAPSPHATVVNSISCSSAANCWVVGAYDAFPGVGNLLAEHWNGNRWTIVPTSGSSGSAGEFAAVSCQAVFTCWMSGSGTRANFMLHLVHGSWRLIQNRPLGEVAADAVTCSSAQSCWSVGLGFMVGHWNGKAWSAATQPMFVGGGFTSVVCPTATECLAVGIWQNNRLKNPIASQRAVAYVARST